MQARAHWFTETPTAAGTEFHVLQRRLDPLIFLKKWFLWFVTALGLTVIMGYMNVFVVALILGVFTLLLGIVVVIFACIAVPLWIGGRDTARFTIRRDAVILQEKLKEAYPDQFPWRDVSEYYVRAADGSRAGNITVTAVAQVSVQSHGGGLLGHTANVGNATGQAIGAGVEAAMQQVSASRFGLAMNVRGSEIVLATLLSSDEANFLLHRIEAALRA